MVRADEREKMKDSAGATVVVIRRQLKHQRRWSTIASQNSTRELNGERRRIVIGVAALIGMRQHNVRSHFIDQICDIQHQLQQMIACFAIDVAESATAIGRDPDMRQRIDDFASTRPCILFASKKSFALRITLVAWCAICHVTDDRVRKTRQQSAGSDCLVIGVCDDNESCRQCLRR